MDAVFLQECLLIEAVDQADKEDWEACCQEFRQLPYSCRVQGHPLLLLVLPSIIFRSTDSLVLYNLKSNLELTKGLEALFNNKNLPEL
jgi:hypothetical protein